MIRKTIKALLITHFIGFILISLSIFFVHASQRDVLPFKKGDLIQLVNQDGIKVAVRYKKMLGEKGNVFLAENIDSEKKLVVKKLIRYKNEKVVENIKKLSKKVNQNSSQNQQLVVGDIYYLEDDELKDQKYNIAPYLDGISHEKKFLFKEVSSGIYDVSGHGEQLVQKAIEVGELVRRTVELGFSHGDVDKQNIILDENSVVHLIDWDNIESLDDSINIDIEIFRAILYLIYPDPDRYYALDPENSDFRKILPYLILSSDKEKSDRSNEKLMEISQKIHDNYYYSSDEMLGYDRKLIVQGIDNMLNDLRKVYIILTE